MSINQYGAGDVAGREGSGDSDRKPVRFNSEGALIRVNPTNGTQTAFLTGEFHDVAQATDGTLYAISIQTIFRINPQTGERSVVSESGLMLSPVRIVVTPDAQLLVADNQSLLRIDPLTGAQSLVSKGGFLGAVQTVAVEATGNILTGGGVVSNGNYVGEGVVRIDRESGAQSVLAVFNPPNSALTGIVVLPDGDVCVIAGSQIEPDRSRQRRHHARV